MTRGLHKRTLRWWLLAAAPALCLPCLAGATDPAETIAANPTEVARRIDALLAEELGTGGRARSLPQVDDYTYLRRVFLDIAGRPPTSAEIRTFVSNSDPARRIAIVDQLLAGTEYGENWAGYWRDVILYRRSENRAVLAARPLSDYLTRSFNDNVGWDEIAQEFITARGNVLEDGSTALVFAQGGRPEETVAELSRIFLGIQIQCAQCHDHPYDSWKREQFHELAAFFPRVSVRPAPLEGMRRGFAVKSIDFGPRRRLTTDRYLGRAEHFMPDLDDPAAEGTRMGPKFFLTGQQVPLGTPDLERRQALANWVTDPNNPWFAKALVNRIWFELIGAGFYEPVDDLGPERDCLAPRTLDLLSREFSAHQFDLKFLFRCITRTEVYQRESRSRPESGERDFSGTYPQRLRSDQLFRALRGFAAEGPVRAWRPKRAGDGPAGLRRAPEQLFAATFGFDPSDPRQEVAGTVPQALALMNSPFLSNLLSADRRGALGQLLREYPDNTELIQELYLRTLSRLPNRAEVRQALHCVEKSGRADGLEDVLWALVNSAEFRYRI